MSESESEADFQEPEPSEEPVKTVCTHYVHKLIHIFEVGKGIVKMRFKPLEPYQIDLVKMKDCREPNQIKL